MRVLAIDGGGIRGLIPALVLAEIEHRSGRPIADCFDLIAGTSTGGLLACALTRPSADDPRRPMFAAGELVELYFAEGASIFHRDLLQVIRSGDGWIDQIYEDSGLRAALERYLGDATLRDAITDVLVTAYEIEHRFAFFFRSARARVDPTYDFTLADTARATSAAPTYFEPAEVRDRAGARSYVLVDGGVFAVNPTMCAITEVTSESGERAPIELLLSLGTGSQKRPLAYEDARRWGRIEWAPRIIDMVFDAVAETVDTQARRMLGDRYVRLQAPLVAGASDKLDNTSAANLAALRDTARRLIAERSDDIDRVVAALVEPPVVS